MLHKRYEYRGVIVGMDPVCRADERWQRVRSHSLVNTCDNPRHCSVAPGCPGI